MFELHGGDIYTFAKARGIKPKEVIDLSSNINPLSPKTGINFNAINARAYPDIHYQMLKERLAAHYNVLPEQVGIFSGASAAIFSLMRSLEGNAILYAPLYGEYKRACKVVGKKSALIHRLAYLDAVPPKNSLVVFVNPSTPDGKYYDLKKLFRVWVEQECTIVIDESFLEFTEYASAISFLHSYSKLYILKSLTKFYACAGVRVGVVISHRDNIEALLQKEPPWMLSVYDEAFVKGALEDKKFAKKTHEFFAKERERLLRMLEEVPQIEKVYPSDVNFFLLKLKEPFNAIKFQNLCTPYNILVRNCASFDFLDYTYIRVAVKGKKESLLLKKVLS